MVKYREMPDHETTTRDTISIDWALSIYYTCGPILIFEMVFVQLYRTRA